MGSRLHTVLVATAIAVLAAALTASAAFAAHKPHPSTVRILNDYRDDATGDFVAVGDVRSATGKCIAGRRVKVFYRGPGSTKFKQVDTARTSANGEWAASGPLGNGVDFIKAVLVRSKYGPRNDRKTCAGDTKTQHLA